MRQQTSLLPRTVPARLLVSAVISGLIYLFVFALPFWLPSSFDIIPPVDYAKLTNYSVSRFLAYVFGVVALFGLAWWAFQQLRPPLRRPNASRRIVFGGAATFALILLFSYPLTAIDLFVYSIRTRGWALYGLPPLSTPPQALPPADPWLGLAGEWVDAASPYGPLWEWLSLAAFYAARTDFLAHLFLLKLLGALAYLGSAWLIYQTLRRLRPSLALAGTLAFAWNPLVLFESVQNAHNDILMVFFLLAAIWLLSGSMPTARLPGRTDPATRLWADGVVCLLLAASILVKFVTVAVAPFFLLAMASHQPTWPRRGVVLLAGGGLMAGVVIALMAPLWPGWQNWAVLNAGSEAGRSVLALGVLALRGWLGTNPAFDTTRAIMFGVIGLIYLTQLWRTARQIRQPMPVTQPIAASFQVFFWYVLLAAGVFHGWYLLWFVPLASLLLPQQKPLAASVIFSLTALLAIPYFETVRVWYPVLLQNQLLGHIIGVPLLVLPPALTLLWPIRPAGRSEV